MKREILCSCFYSITSNDIFIQLLNMVYNIYIYICIYMYMYITSDHVLAKKQ